MSAALAETFGSLASFLDLDVFEPVDVEGHRLLRTGEFTEKDRASAKNFNARARGYDRGSQGVGWRGPEVSRDKLHGYLQEHQPFVSGGDSLRVVEIAAANGYSAQFFSAFFKDLGFDALVVGVDVAEKILAQGLAKNRLDFGIHANCTSALERFHQDSVHVVNALGVVELLDRVDFENLVEQAARVLTPGGVFNLSFELKGTDSYPGNIQYKASEIVDLIHAQGFALHGEPEIVSDAWHNKGGNGVANGFVTAFRPV